ncbi:MAG: carboxypeptidase regulatory-like domain-containing protein [Terriglobales bacterium]|jgi:outer membrane receptor protein involved in Fe transport
MKYRLPIVLLVLALSSVLALGQTETGAITGTVTDPTGAVVSGATVTATNTATGAVRTATTGASGSYTLSSLPPDPYEVAITAAGFVTFKRNLTVQVASLTELSARMSVAATGTTVEVSAGAGAVEVETQSSEISQMVSAQQVAELPSLTRNPYDFVATAGNVAADPGMRGANGAAINGQRSASTDILLDGAENVDLYSATVGQQVPMDAVQEFRVSTSSFTAEYGRASGGVVNVATKSGTNGLHGSGYEFNRLSALASNTYDNNANGIPRAGFTRNQFGYSIGGPIIKNKLFFFNTTEWVRVRAAATGLAYVPDTAFLGLTDAATQAFFSQYGTLKPSATIKGTLTAGYLQTAGVAGPLLGAVPAATNVLDLVSYSFPSDVGGGLPQNTYNDVARVDFNLSSKTQMFGRYAIYNDSYFPGSISSNAYVGYDTAEKDKNQNFLFSLTHLWTNNFISSTKLSFNRLNDYQGLGSAGTVPGLLMGLGGDGGTPVPTGPFATSQSYILPGYLPYAPGSAIPFGGPQNVSEIDQSISWTRGRHSLKVGGEYVYVRDNRVFGAYQEGIEYLSSGGDTASALDQMLAGQLYRFSAAIDPQGEFPCQRDPYTNQPIQTPACTLIGPATSPNFSRSNRYNDAGLYFQDSWKVFPRFTFNYGLRWEYYGVQHDKHQSNDANFVLGSGSNIYQQVTNGQVESGSNLPNGGRLWAPQYHNFGPRVGFAWDIFGDGKTSLRGGYGIAFERNFGNVTFNVIQNPPNYAVLNVVAGRDVPVGTLPIFVDNLGAAAQPGSFAFRSPTLRAVATNIKPAYANVWNFSIEREVARSTVAALEYSGSRGIHGYGIGNYNDIGYGPAFSGVGCGATGGAACADPFQQLNLQYSYTNYRGNGNDSWHDALNAKLTSSNLFKQGLNITANYTWSHTIDYLSATFGGSDEWGGQALGTLNPFDPQLDRGDSDYDVRNRLALSAVWAPPYAQHTHGFVKEALDGWEFAPIFSASSGYPYTIYDCTNADTVYTCPRYIPSGPVARTGSTTKANAIANNLYPYETIPAPLIYGSIYGGNSGVPTCDSDPTTGLSLGTNCVFPTNMTARNAFRQPGVWDLNLGISKSFKVTEKVNLQFRSEFYNLFNHSNYYVQTGNADAIGGLGDVANLYFAGTPTAFATGTNNGQVEYCTSVTANVCTGTPVPYTLAGKRGVQSQAFGVGTGSLGERRFIQFALRLSF